eukprot:CAMPEP_0117010402 /NCGR_PEP_ID=MMETSP0472-20121206/9174_1 /TAXON_ID=693140 ORGANISM="Tiarina fusus, Strain LIS" /NCGR_SAMPLE_ID=MMETSP0472 /ASSEMBLY_ACC=CAM_ASM_000603 /LENGTH=446 /DNA_ID=CAMNT_0004712919 /DNA_START=651 /DNA_END=1991 /DNA_ORIENTATION=+
MIRKVIELKNTLELGESHSYLLIPTTSKQYSSAHLCNDYCEDSDTDADSGGEDPLSVSSQKELKEKLVAAVSRKEEPVPDEEASGSVLGKRQRGGRAAASNRSLRNLLFDGESEDVIPAGPVWIFFITLRDLFVARDNNEMTLPQLIEEFEHDESRLACLCPSYSLREFLCLGLNFLQQPPLVNSSDDKKKKSRRKTSNPKTPSDKGEAQKTPSAPEYQVGNPFISCIDEEKETYRWVGAVEDEIIREELDTLELLFYFALTRNQVSECKTQVNLVAVKQQKCASTIRRSTTEETNSFREQERERYLTPERPFRYQFRDYETVIAPMKRGLGNQSQKPRCHPLLQSDRPPHISLLCLVRDAAARLPGGIGTRLDVAILLCDSQFVVQGVSETKLNDVVSGALDRLQAQADPCVKFDNQQKLWIYLHRQRKEENFSIYKAPKKKGRR